MSLPRLLAGVTDAPMGYDRHLQVHGEPLRNGSPTALAAVIERSGLRGRGGGGFPLASKLAAVRRGRGAPILVVNACEGEPMSAKDRVLLTRTPHLVLDGALALARVIGASEIVIAVDMLGVRAGESMQSAMAERPELVGGRLAAHVAWVPSGYVSGQESALVRWCNDGIAKPTMPEPRVTERGIARRPTLVSNAETVAHVALITRHGADWFRALGTDDDPGSLLVTLGGAVDRPGVYETEHGTGLAALVNAAGGLTEPARAFLIGGYSGAWVDAADMAKVRLARRELRNVRARLGSGVIVVLGRSACPVAEVTEIAGWLADESAGQCGPCVHGLAAVADELASVCEGTAEPEGLRRIGRWCALSAGRGACAHPDGAATFITSGLRVFASQFQNHARHGPCTACQSSPVLSIPRPRVSVA